MPAASATPHRDRLGGPASAGLERLADQRPEPFWRRPTRIAEAELVVAAARAQAGRDDRGVEPLDRRSLLGVRTEMEDLSDGTLLEGADPKVRGVLRQQLRAAASKRGGELLVPTPRRAGR